MLLYNRSNAGWILLRKVAIIHKFSPTGDPERGVCDYRSQFTNYEKNLADNATDILKDPILFSNF